MSLKKRKKSSVHSPASQVNPKNRRLRRVLCETLFLVLLIVAFCAFLALISFDIRDSGWTSTGDTNATYYNLTGCIGAVFADVMLSLFGFAAYLIPILIAYVGFILFRPRPEKETFHTLASLLKWSGFLITLASCATLAALHYQVKEGLLPQAIKCDLGNAGGIVGCILANKMHTLLGGVGATLILLALLLGGVTFFTGISWFSVMDGVGNASLWLMRWGRRQTQRLREWMKSRSARNERRATLVKENMVRATRVPPRISKPTVVEEKSKRDTKERQLEMFKVSPNGLPPLSALDEPPKEKLGYSKESLEAMSRLVEMKLRDFGVEVQVVAVEPGPVITRYELQPAVGVKVNQISNLSKDLARALSCTSVRIVEVIAGKSVVGLEIPNATRQIIALSEIVRSKQYDSSSSPLTVALGKDIGGKSMVADLNKMPHLLVAGTTGSGKSVCVNAMIVSLLYKSTPDQVRMILIDPKMLELSVYEGIPHLLAPVVTDMKEAAMSLRWCVAEMERRYKLMAFMGVRNIAGCNKKIIEAEKKGEPLRDPLFKPSVVVVNQDDDGNGTIEQAPVLETLPYIVVFIDEFADMIMAVGKKVEELIARLAQKARASGIHLVLATQRPSVDVITGLIKANIPTRIAFQVSSKIDSRTVLDQMGAESLLGQGDMLYLPPGSGVPVRVHGAFVSDHEVHRVVSLVKANGEANYVEGILDPEGVDLDSIPGLTDQDSDDAESDPLYDQAVRVVLDTRKASISGVQRRLKIGYNRAARLVEQMEVAGIVGPLHSNGSREILIPDRSDGQ